MNVREKKNYLNTGGSSTFNTSTTGEVIVNYDDEYLCSFCGMRLIKQDLVDGLLFPFYCNECSCGFVDLPPQHCGADSCFIRDLEVWVEALPEWKDMRQAFKDKDLIIDNHNTCFFEPTLEEDRERGFTL